MLAVSGSVLVTGIRTKPLVVTGQAPGYTAVTSRLVPGATQLTLSLYRPAGQWLLYGASANRNQYQPAIRLRPPFRVVWGRNLGTLLEFPAVIDDGVAYLSNLHGQLFALSMSDGKVIWHVDMHTREEDSSPAVVGSELVAHVKAGRVLVLDRVSGRILWSQDVSGEVESSPVVEDGIDYLGDWAGDVYALDLKTKKFRWTYHDGCKITASVAIVGRALYLGDYCGRVFALDRANGHLLWTASAGSPVYGTSAVAGGRVFVPSRDAGRSTRSRRTGSISGTSRPGPRLLRARRLARPGLLRLVHRAAVLRLGEDGSRALDARHGRRDLRLADRDRRCRLRRNLLAQDRRRRCAHRAAALLASRTASTSPSRGTPAASCSTAGRASGPSSHARRRRRGRRASGARCRARPLA